MGASMLKQVHRCLGGSLAVLCMGLSAGVVADVECTRAERASWMDESDFRQHMKSQGVQITKFLVTPGNCYEVYGFDKSGKKVEIYSNPVDASPVADIPPVSVAKP